MKIERRDSNDESLVLSGMLTDSSVLGSIATRWNGNLFRSKWSNIVAGWAVDYYLKYDEAPVGAIEPLFEQWAADQDDEDRTVGLDRTLPESPVR